MIHWSYTALRPCAVVIGEFVWGEAAWGTTIALRRLRLIRLTIILLCAISTILICWAALERSFALNRADSYSYYEGKVLEERLTETKRQLEAQSEDIKSLFQTAQAATLLAARMQAQLEKQQDMMDSWSKILGALVLTPVLAILWSIFKTGLRRERPALGQHLSGGSSSSGGGSRGRRDTNSVLDEELMP